MGGEKAFEALLSKRLEPWFRARGFARKQRRFVKWVDQNCQVVGFRRGRGTPREVYVFLADLGILSPRIWNFFVRVNESGRVRAPWNYPVSPNLPSFPLPEDCHWRTSIQEPILLRAYFNRPWSIQDETEVPLLADEIEGVLADYALPALDRYVSDEALRDLWLKGPKFLISDIQHLEYLAILLRELGPRAELPPVMEKLRNLARDKPMVGAVVAELGRTGDDKRVDKD
jgi:hypothetical protein